MKPSCLLVFAFLLEWAMMPGQNMTNQTGSETGAIRTDFAVSAAQCKKLLAKDSANVDLNYQLGNCYLRSRSQKNKALPYLQKTFAAGKTDPGMHRLLADAWFAVQDFEQASMHYRLCRQKLALKNAPFYQLTEIDHRLELCRMGQEIKDLKNTLTEVSSIHYANNGSQAEALTNEAAGASALNSVKKTFRQDQDLFMDEEIIDLQKATYPPDDTIINKEATVATSFDGQIMLIYRNDEGKGNLYLSMLEGNDWTAPDLVNRMINLSGWEENEYISADGNTLYFTSERAGGYGGKDIYKCTRTADGEWSRALNLGAAINGPYDEIAPCILPDGVTLYFSSNRNKSKSNFDIYMSTYADSGKWRTPLSVGYPVKKETSEKSAQHRAPEKDNYLVTFNATQAIPITLLRGKLSDEKDQFPTSAEITVINNVTGEISGIYHPDEASGHYNLLLPPGKNNNVTFEATGYLFHSENIDLTGEPSLYKVVTPTVMKPFMENSSEILNNVFFAEKSTTLQAASLPELQKLHLFLTNNPGCRIELGCAGVANDDSENGRLAGARARVVAGYLLEQGIGKDRIVTHAYVAKKKRRKKRTPTIALVNTEKIEIKITDIK